MKHVKKPEKWRDLEIHLESIFTSSFTTQVCIFPCKVRIWEGEKSKKREIEKRVRREREGGWERDNERKTVWDRERV